MGGGAPPSAPLSAFLAPPWVGCVTVVMADLADDRVVQVANLAGVDPPAKEGRAMEEAERMAAREKMAKAAQILRDQRLTSQWLPLTGLRARPDLVPSAPSKWRPREMCD